MEHDNSYKLLFSHAEMVADLLRGFVKEPWIEAVDFTTLERYSASSVSDDLRARHDDLIWRVRRRDRIWLYIYILLEFQASVDTYMAVRVWVYMGLLYQELIRAGQLAPSGRLPPVFPLVLYNGREGWTAAQELALLIEPVGEGLERYVPQLRYLLLEEARYPMAELAPLQNLAAALFRLENSRDLPEAQAAIQALDRGLRSPQQDSLRRAFVTWLARVLLPNRLPKVTLPVLNDLAEIKAMLTEDTIDWTWELKRKAWEEGLAEGRTAGQAEGRAEGQAEGHRHALAAERALLLRQAGKRFGETCAQALAPLLEAIEDQERLAEIGEWIVDCDSGDALLARIKT